MIKKSQLFLCFLPLILISISNARFLETLPPLANDQILSELKCGECILRNKTFCVKAQEGLIVESVFPPSYCCDSEQECESLISDSSWSCSNKYLNTVDKFKVCPFSKSQCGSESTLNISSISDTHCLKIESLQ